MGITMPVTSRTSPCSCIYIDAQPFSWPWFAGIPRYTARLSLALAAHVPVRFFDEGQELLPPRHLSWSQDQDLEHWGRRIWRGRRRPLGTPPADCIGLYCSARPSQRIFPYEVSILHDFCPMVVPWAFPDDGPGRLREVLDREHPGLGRGAVGLALDEGRRGLVLRVGPRADRRGAAGAEPLRGDPSPSRAGRAVGPDRPGGLDDRAAEERRLPVRLVPEDDAAAARHGAVVGGETRLDDLARGAPADGESRRGAPGPVPGERLRRPALPPLPEGRLVDLPVAVRRVRLSDPRLAAARYARPVELHQFHGRI